MRYAKRLAKTAISSVPNLAAVTALLPQSALPEPRAYASPQCGSGAAQKRCCFPDGSLGDHCTVGRSKIDLAGTLFPPDQRVPHPAKNRLSQCRELKGQYGDMLFSSDPTDHTNNAIRKAVAMLRLGNAVAGIADAHIAFLGAIRP